MKENNSVMIRTKYIDVLISCKLQRAYNNWTFLDYFVFLITFMLIRDGGEI